MADALRELCSRRSSVRDKVVLAAVTYVKSPEAVFAILCDQFLELGIDYIDIFFWGWIGANDGHVLDSCLRLSPDLKSPQSVYKREMSRLVGISEHLKESGVARYVGASFHDINLARQFLRSPLLDVVMVRHNPGYRRAKTEIFDQLTQHESQRPGIVSFKSMSCRTGNLWEVPAGLPPGCWQPQAPDFYRYALSQNCVDVCLTGARSRREIDAAIQSVKQGKLTSHEIDYLNLYGDLHQGNFQVIPKERLLWRP